MLEKIENKIFDSTKGESKNCESKNLGVKMWVKNVTLQKYDSKKCCFKNREKKKEELKMGKWKMWEWKMGQ